ncbi:hypothetical protein Slin_4687 [Spirosoma linguale DSM 74]|uniref:Uncharacterized protein n=1 Tax=Spirosoma linguale (strain ATCC 33905 / DSM 74 / LMG 10896 / Claus 1) TaxID=504472 RepID=D2QPK6_SPILD|nr:hypothetical protein Slin_4687 [Spirosoma linguale DSM 74]
MQLRDGKNQIPIAAPDYVAPLNAEALEELAKPSEALLGFCFLPAFCEKMPVTPSGLYQL